MPPSVDLTELQNAAGSIIDQHKMLVTAGPVTAGLVARLVTKNKLVSNALVGGGTLIAIQTFAGPYLQLMKDQFGYLMSLLGN